MKKLTSSEDLPQLKLLQGILEANGVKTVTMNETIFGVNPEVGFTNVWPELWVVNEKDFEKAKQIVADYND